MIKKILFIILMACPGYLLAQTQQTQGAPNTLITNRGGFVSDSLIQVPRRSGTPWHGGYSDFIHEGGKLKYWDSSAFEYKNIGGSGDGLEWVDTNVIATHTFIHNSTIQSASVTGTATKTLKLTRGDNTFISTTFTDKDNQTISYTSGSKTLSISGGNSVVLPIDYGELQQTITGQTSPVFTLSQPINTGKHLTIVMNSAVIYPEDYSITAANQITLSFVPAASDRFLFFYKEN